MIGVTLIVGDIEVVLEEELNVLMTLLYPLSGKSIGEIRHYLGYYLGCIRNNIEDEFAFRLLDELDSNPEGIFKVGK